MPAVEPTLSSLLESRVAARPAAPSVVSDGAAVTYAELHVAVSAEAARLAARSVAGRHVVILVANSSAFAVAFFAVARALGIATPLNPGLRMPEIAAFVEDLAAPVVLTTPDLAERLVGAPFDGRVLRVGEATGDLATAPDPPSARDRVLCLFSSGTTGKPKRIERTHGQVAREVKTLAATLRITGDDRVIGVAPFSHVNGLVRSMITSLASGAVLVPVPQYERRQVGQTIERHRISVFIGVPFMFAMLGDTRWPRPVDFSSLRICVSASAPLKQETVQKFHERYGIAIRQLYGTTETGSIAVNVDADPLPSWESVGTPLPGVDVRAFSDTYQPLPRGEKGLLGISSPSAISAYADPASGRDSFVNGWFFPGDVGRCDAEGRVYLEGRRSLFINRGGYKVNPYEVEAVLERHPNVREAVVVGVPAEHGDQKVKAIVVPAEPCTEREIVDHCRVALADFKVPSIVEFRSELPKSPTGKLLRSGL